MKKLNIFYLDDSEILTDVFKAYFQKKEYKITTLNSISENSYPLFEKYDLLFLDFDLGRTAKFNGGEICKTIKTNNRNQKIYIFSANKNLNMAEFEADGFIEKTPHAYEKIEEIIKRMAAE